jgi:hypothetical protein
MFRFVHIFSFYLLSLFAVQKSVSQKAAFINGGFIVAAYSEYDQKTKLINTYTNQIFAWYEHKGGNPDLWFAGNLLIVADNQTVTVVNFQKNEKTNYPLTGKPVYGTILELIEKDDTLLLKNILQKNIKAKITKKKEEKILACAVSGNEEKLILLVNSNSKNLLKAYDLRTSSQPLWEKEVTATVKGKLTINNNGSMFAFFDGTAAQLINTADGSLLHSENGTFHTLRFSSKDELICMNADLLRITLLGKSKKGDYKAINTAIFKNGPYTSQQGKDVQVDWEIASVSDDLTMLIGFGSNAVALYKNGPVLIFF